MFIVELCIENGTRTSKTEPKESFQIVVSDNKTKFNPHIQLKTGKKYEIALVNLETYYSFPNVDDTNNHFSYSPDGDKLGIVYLYQKAATILKI